MSAVGRPRPAGRAGGIEVEISAQPAVVGWINRFAGRNTGVADLAAHPDRLTLIAGDGICTATVEVPFAPMSIGHREPVEALVSPPGEHRVAGPDPGPRRRPLLIGTSKDGVVLSSST